jgi:hypothetical protein
MQCVSCLVVLSHQTSRCQHLTKCSAFRAKYPTPTRSSVAWLPAATSPSPSRTSVDRLPPPARRAARSATRAASFPVPRKRSSFPSRRQIEIACPFYAVGVFASGGHYGRLTEEPAWDDFWGAIFGSSPGSWRPPSRYLMANKYLDAVRNKVVSQVDTYLSGCSGGCFSSTAGRVRLAARHLPFCLARRCLSS